MSDLTGFQKLSVFTSGLSSLGDYMSHSGAASGYDLQAGLLDLDAQGVIQTGEYTADRIRKYGNKFLARQEATYAKAGVVTTEGSPALAFLESEKEISMDTIYTKLNAVKKADRIRGQVLMNKIAAGRERTAAISSIGQGLLNMGKTYAGYTA